MISIPFAFANEQLLLLTGSEALWTLTRTLDLGIQCLGTLAGISKRFPLTERGVVWDPATQIAIAVYGDPFPRARSKAMGTDPRGLIVFFKRRADNAPWPAEAVEWPYDDIAPGSAGRFAGTILLSTCEGYRSGPLVSFDIRERTFRRDLQLDSLLGGADGAASVAAALQDLSLPLIQSTAEGIVVFSSISKSAIWIDAMHTSYERFDTIYKPVIGESQGGDVCLLANTLDSTSLLVRRAAGEWLETNRWNSVPWRNARGVARDSHGRVVVIDTQNCLYLWNAAQTEWVSSKPSFPNLYLDWVWKHPRHMQKAFGSDNASGVRS